MRFITVISFLLSTVLYAQLNDCKIQFENMYAADQFAKALKIAEKCEAVKLDPKLEHKRIKCLMRVKSYVIAITAYQNLIKSDTENAKYLNGIGAAYFMLEQTDSAIFYYKRALVLDPKNEFSSYNIGVYHFNKGENKKAIEILLKHTSFYKDDIEGWSILGEAYLADSNFTSSFEAFNKALSIDPLNNKALVGMSNYYSLQESFDLAHEYIDKAILNYPKRASNYYEKGDIYYFQDEFHYKEAIVWYTKSIRIKKNADIYNLMGSCYENLFKDRLAIKYYTKALELEDSEANYFYDLSYVLSLNNKLPLAFEMINKAIELDKNDPYYFATKAAIVGAQGELEKAIEYYTLALELGGEEAVFFYNRGAFYEGLEDYDAAIADYSEAIKLDPKSSDSYYNRALCYMEQSKNELALIDCNKYIKLNPNDPDGYYCRASCYSNLLDSDALCADMHKAADLGDKDALKYVKKYCR